MKKIFLLILLIIVSVIGNAQTLNEKVSKLQSFIVGGVSIKIPVPDTAMVEVGKANRSNMEIFVPQNNKLISAYVLTNDLPILFKENNNTVMSKYALVEVPRGGENMDCGADDFKEVVNGAKESFGGEFSSVLQESEDEFNRRIKSLDLADMQIRFGQTTQLGCFFSKQDIIGFGILASYEMGGNPIKMGMVVSLIRVNKRLLFVYLYAEYKDDETIKWLRNVGEKWNDEIMKINKAKPTN
jgi:hypothetical protein